jgi:uncharacterized membrane protein SirB2
MGADWRGRMAVVTTVDEVEREARRLRWPLFGMTLLLVAMAYALFAAVYPLHPTIAKLVAPIPLWLGTQFLFVAMRIMLGGTAFWRRATRSGTAERFALISALVVGAWIGSGAAPAFALLVLPTYAAIENPVRRRLLPPPDETYGPVSVLRWVACVAGGEILGYLAAVVIHQAVR